MRQACHIVDQVDEDGDGYIDFPEFKHFLAIMNGETVYNEIDMRHQLIESVPLKLAKGMKKLDEIVIPKSEIDMYFGKAMSEKLMDHC
jgi:hypothetical protein